MEMRSKIDAWLLVVISLAMVLTLSATYSAASHATGMSVLLPMLIAAFTLGFLAWVLLATKYRIHNKCLTVRSGPFVWKIPVAEITRMTPTKSPISSPALSLDRLQIEYGKGKVILVSPPDQQLFIRAIQDAGNAA